MDFFWITTEQTCRFSRPSGLCAENNSNNKKHHDTIEECLKNPRAWCILFIHNASQNSRNQGKHRKTVRICASAWLILKGICVRAHGFWGNQRRGGNVGRRGLGEKRLEEEEVARPFAKATKELYIYTTR